MRLPVTPQLNTKDGTANRNARLTNMLKESSKAGDKAVIRPGLVLDAVASGVGRGLVVFNNDLVSVYGATLGYGVAEDINGVIGSTTTNATWGKMAFGGGLYCAAGVSKTAVSADGVSWTEASLTGTLTAIGYGNSVFVVMRGGTVNGHYSSDGITWNAVTLPNVLAWQSIAWNGSIFVAVAGERFIATSPTGVIWTQRQPITGFSWTWTRVEAVGSLFCTIGGGYSAISTDGISWTHTAMPAGSFLNIASNGTFFCATGVNLCAVSTDGVSWTSSTMGDSTAYENLIWDGSRFIAVGGSVYGFSTNGLDWDFVSHPTAVTSWAAGASDGSGSTISLDSGATTAIKLGPGGITALATITGDRYDFAQGTI